MTSLSKLPLKLRFSIAVTVLTIATCAVLVIISNTQAKQSMLQDAQARQDTSLRIMASNFEAAFSELDVQYAADGTLVRATWANIPSFENHELIDHVGRISGETATLFVWDDTEGDFIRTTTNIVKPDGSRAVGTYLGKQNPVFASIIRGDVYRGEAIILGKPYFTIYQPVNGADGVPIGILYVGVDRTVVDAAIAEKRNALLLVSSLAVGIGVIVVFFTISYLLRPLSTLSRAIGQLRAGDFDIQVPYQDQMDEIGEIATSVIAFKTDLQKNKSLEDKERAAQEEQNIAITALREGLNRLAQRDLTSRIASTIDQPFPEEYEPLRNDFNSVVDGLAATVSEMDQNASEVTIAATSIADMSDVLARRVENQAATLAQSASTLTSLAESGNILSQKADDVNNMASKSLTLSSESREVLDNATAAIQEIEESSDQINNIMTVIEDIAFQTNLLALNAGVEAARAGEAGKGFAVVASEVRGLSLRATESASEIRKLITASREKISDGTVLVKNTGESLKQLLEQVEKMGGVIKDISAAINDQSHGQSEVTLGVRQLDSMTQENAALGEEANAASDLLKTEAQNLSRTLNTFKTSATPVATKAAA